MTSLPSTDNKILSPMQPEFNKQILKMKMNDIVSIALEQKPPSLKKQYMLEEEKTIDIIMLLLIKFQNFYNCKNKMDKNQLEETAYMIVEKFSYFNYYDIAMCLKLAKMNEKVFDRIDGGMIFEWLVRYDITRTGMIVTEREKQQALHNSSWSRLAERTSEMTRKDWLKNER